MSDHQFQRERSILTGSLQRGTSSFQAAVFNRVAASATLRSSRQPSRLPETLERRHRAFSILQSLTGAILSLLGFVALAWSQSASPLGTAIGVWTGPAYLIAGQLGIQAGRRGNGGRSRRATLRWSLISFSSCVASFGAGLAAVIIRAKQISLPPAPVAASDCVNLSLISFGACLAVVQSVLAAQSVWHCSWGYLLNASAAAQLAPPVVAPSSTGGICFIDGTRQCGVSTSAAADSNSCCPGCNRSWTGLPEKATPTVAVAIATKRLVEEPTDDSDPPPRYHEWHSLNVGHGRLPSTESSAESPPAGLHECQSMIARGERHRKGKNLRVHWEV